MDKISIIIPVYNAESYLSQCLDSIINQTYKNLEIILINSASTDSSGIICDAYAAKYNHIRVYHSKISGVSIARNIGLKHATGKFIAFVDSDDYISPNMYESLYYAINETNVDIVVCGFYRDIQGIQHKINNESEISNGILSTADLLRYALDRSNHEAFCIYLWNKLYKADIIQKNNIRFDEKINYGEDTLFYVELVIKSKAIGTYLNKPLCFYRIRDNQTTATKSISLRKHTLITYKKTEQMLLDNGYEELAYLARAYYCYHASVIAQLASEKGNISTLEEMQKEIISHKDDYIATNLRFPKKITRINSIINLS